MHASVKNEFLAKIEELSHGLPSNPLDQMASKLQPTNIANLVADLAI